MIYTLTLNPALDYILDVESLSADDINRTKKEALYPGGKGINVSIILSRLGVESTALGFLAGFSGIQIEKMLQEEKINTDFVYLSSGFTRINVKLRSKTELDINARGPEPTAKDVERLLGRLERLSKSDTIVLAGSIPPSVPESIYDEILSRITVKGCKSVVDAEGELLLSTLKYRPFLIKPNHKELGKLFSANADSTGRVVSYALKLREMGARNVLVSRAEKGAILADESGAVTSIGAIRGKLVNSTGCGDSMVAGFLAGFGRNQSYEEALRLGAASGSAAAFSHGLAQKEDIYKILSQKELVTKKIDIAW